MRTRALLGRLTFYPAVGGSLLVIPAGLPWMALAWWVAISAFLWRGSPSRLPGLALLSLLVVKWPDPAPGLVAFLLVLSVVTGAAPALARNPPGARAATATLFLAWGCFLWNWSDSVHTHRRPTWDPGRPIVIVGDSLSAGTYARDLTELVTAPVLDLAVGGTTAEEGLAALPRALDTRPQAVLIEFGGHDFLRGRPRHLVRRDLDRMIRLCREAGAEPILFEIPRGFLTDGFGGLERGLSREHDLEVIPDGVIRSLVLRSPWAPVRIGEPLSDDGLHPNSAGSEHLARAATAALVRIYGPAILDTKGWAGRVGRIVTVDGTAQNQKVGGALVTDRGTLWIEPDPWPEAMNSRRLRVTGMLLRRDDLPIVGTNPGEPPRAGVPVPKGMTPQQARRRYVLADPQWIRLD